MKVKSIAEWGALEELFHVYLNKFDKAVSHLFVVIFDNN